MPIDALKRIGSSAQTTPKGKKGYTRESDKKVAAKVIEAEVITPPDKD